MIIRGLTGGLSRQAPTSKSDYRDQPADQISATAATSRSSMRHWFQGAFSDPIFRPNLSNNLTVAIGVGLVGGILLVFLFEHLDDTIKTSEEVENWVQAPGSRRYSTRCIRIIPRSQEKHIFPYPPLTIPGVRSPRRPDHWQPRSVFRPWRVLRRPCISPVRAPAKVRRRSPRISRLPWRTPGTRYFK